MKLVIDGSDRRLLGVHIVGEGATELIHQGQAVLHFGGSVDYFIHATFDVPTMSDAYKYTGIRLPSADGRATSWQEMTRSPWALRLIHAT